jgi:hypothetical protein
MRAILLANATATSLGWQRCSAYSRYKPPFWRRAVSPHRCRHLGQRSLRLANCLWVASRGPNPPRRRARRQTFRGHPAARPASTLTTPQCHSPRSSYRWVILLSRTAHARAAPGTASALGLRDQALSPPDEQIARMRSCCRIRLAGKPVRVSARRRMCATARSTPSFIKFVEEYYPAFKAHLGARDARLPGYVEQEQHRLVIPPTSRPRHRSRGRADQARSGATCPVSSQRR